MAQDAAPPPSAEESAAPSDAQLAVVLPTRLLGGDGEQWRKRAGQLDSLLSDTAQDLGLEVDVGRAPAGDFDEGELARLAANRRALVILPIVHVADSGLQLRIVAARPDSKVLLSRVQQLTADQLDVRAVVMLRDVVRAANQPGPVNVKASSPIPIVQPAEAHGRIILATNGTLFGAFVGYSLQRSSASDDPRLLYPLLAVGAGVGLGAAVIIADEWDVGVGDAWYLAAGAWWPAVSGHLIYEGRFGGEPGASNDEAWSFGLIASVTGLTLSTVGLLSRGMGDGGAVLAHSGGAFGMLVGGLGEFAYLGEVGDEIPHAGMGYGAAAGWLAASALAVNFHPDPGRLLAIDLGVALGGLAGASAGSPLLFGDATKEKARGWVAAAGGGMLVGGGLALILSWPDEAPQTDISFFESSDPSSIVARWSLPQPTILASPTGRTTAGVGWQAALW